MSFCYKEKEHYKILKQMNRDKKWSLLVRWARLTHINGTCFLSYVDVNFETLDMCV